MVIDLRNAASYQRAHINGAVNIPYEEIDQRISELPRDKILVFYCAKRRTKHDGMPLSVPHGIFVLNVANGIAYYPGKIYLVRGKFIDRCAL